MSHIRLAPFLETPCLSVRFLVARSHPFEWLQIDTLKKVLQVENLLAFSRPDLFETTELQYLLAT